MAKMDGVFPNNGSSGNWGLGTRSHVRIGGDSLRENFSFRSSAAISLRYRHFPRLAGTGEAVDRVLVARLC